MDDIIELASYDTVFAAEIAEAQLTSEGITAKVVTDNAGGALPSLSPLSGGAKIIVRREDAERARAALAGLSDDEDD